MFDLLIQNGTVLDGSGKAGFLADVAVKAGKIAAIGTNLGKAVRILDATGLVVTPGFIDSHSHADKAILAFPEQIEKVEQGITTSIGGQCGSSPYPVAEGETVKTFSSFMEKAKNIPQGANIACFVGHGAVRKAVMGLQNRSATPEELEKMKELVRDAMDAGAMGLSYGLYYSPGCFADTNEAIQLAKVVAEKGGILSAHIRNESDQLVEAVEEFLTIAKAAGVRGVVSHHKAGYAQNHGKVNITLKMMEDANREGMDIYCDVYPYIASRTSVSSVFVPKQYRDGGLAGYLKDLALRQQFRDMGIARHGEDLSWVLLNVCSAYPAYSGLNIHEAAKLHGKDDWDTLYDILEKQPGATACFFTQSERDMKTVMAWERSMICTDSSVAGKTTAYHPRLRGSFPRALGRYVREQGVTTLPEMIRKMTSLPAKVYDLKGKGLLREGFDGDICVFDPMTIIDKATFTEVTHRAEGLRWVIVGGEIAAENAVATGICAGKVLPRK